MPNVAMSVSTSASANSNVWNRRYAYWEQGRSVLIPWHCAVVFEVNKLIEHKLFHSFKIVFNDDTYEMLRLAGSVFDNALASDSFVSVGTH